MAKSLEIQWPSEDIDTLAHTSVLKVDGRSVISPLQAVHSPHRSLTSGQSNEIPSLRTSEQAYSPLIIVGETLRYDTVTRIGRDADINAALMNRIKGKVVKGRMNIAFTRISQAYHPQEGQEVPAPRIDRLRASALVRVQLEADASLILPPLPTGINSKNQFYEILEHTQIELQTFKVNKEIVGFIPTMNDLALVREMVRQYVKIGCRVFAVDFSGASNRPPLMRMVVGTIRESLRIKTKAREIDEKYYIHVFNVPASRKSDKEVAPLSDILTHPYGVDSTSGVMWGGNVDDVRKLRYYQTDDYGAYRGSAIGRLGTRCNCPVCKKYGIGGIYSGSVSTVLDKLQTHRLHAYTNECKRISDRINSSDSSKGYLPYLHTKSKVENEVAGIIEDVREIKARL